MAIDVSKFRIDIAEGVATIKPEDGYNPYKEALKANEEVSEADVKKVMKFHSEYYREATTAAGDLLDKAYTDGAEVGNVSMNFTPNSNGKIEVKSQRSYEETVPGNGKQTVTSYRVKVKNPYEDAKTHTKAIKARLTKKFANK